MPVDVIAPSRAVTGTDSVPVLMGEDITANFFLLALESLDVSKHTVCFETVSKLG
jgi:hypothetical protein